MQTSGAKQLWISYQIGWLKMIRIRVLIITLVIAILVATWCLSALEKDILEVKVACIWQEADLATRLIDRHLKVIMAQLKPLTDKK